MQPHMNSLHICAASAWPSDSYLVNRELNRFERAKGGEDLLDVALTDIASQVSNMKPGGLQNICVPICLDLHGCRGLQDVV